MNWIKKAFLVFVVKRSLPMTKIRKWLDGKKTYLISIAGILTTLVAYASGNIELGDALEKIFPLLLAITIRVGIKKKPE